MNQLFRKKSIVDILKNHKEAESKGIGMKKTLGVRDLTAFGIAAIIGAGIFSTIGNACFNGGPAVSLLFVFTALACAFSALSYAEFSSLIPVSGSAYTYAYVSFGELVAWIIGWSLIMEYAVGNIAVAISWSDYFTSLLSGLGVKIPEYFTMDYLSAMRGYKEAIIQLAGSTDISTLSESLQLKYLAWTNAPQIGGMHIIGDLPALLITILITSLVYRGIQESRNASNIMVAIKLLVVLAVIGVGVFYVKPANWDPFAPNGIEGVLKGVSSVFFAYIGFDAISTTAEECKNPQRDLPRGMFYALIICTVLYVIITLVLTGLVPYTELAVGDPLAFVFHKIGMDWFSGVIAVSAVAAMASVLLVFQLGQPRIWMSMSRDGLLPKAFSKLHPKYKTPGFATIVAGFMVGVPALFMNLTEVTDLTSIGTLFAFVLVNGGVLLLQLDKNTPPRAFKIPFINARYVVPVMVLIGFSIFVIAAPQKLIDFIMLHKAGINPIDVFVTNIPYYFFIILTVGMAYFSFTKNLSLFPCLGLISCFYLMTELGISNWKGFGIWLILGLIIYFGYGYRNSVLEKKQVKS